MIRRYRTILILSIVLNLIFVAACGAPTPEPAAEPAPTATPEPVADEAAETEWAPDVLLRMGHDGERVRSVAYSPDGKILASGISSMAQLWDATDGTLLRGIEQRHAVDDLVFSPDSEILAAGLGLYGVMLNRVDDGAPLHQLGSGYNNVVAYSPDGETAATGNRSGLVWVWDVESGEQIAEWEAEDGFDLAWMTALAYSPDGDILAAGHFDGVVRLWRVVDGELLHTLDPQSDWGRADDLAFSPDGALLAVAGAQDGFDHVLRLWQVDDGTLYRDLPLEGGASYGVAYSPDGEMLALALDQGVHIWDTGEWALVWQLPHETDDGEQDPVLDVAFSPDGRTVLAGTQSGYLCLWQVRPTDD